MAGLGSRYYHAEMVAWRDGLRGWVHGSDLLMLDIPCSSWPYPGVPSRRNHTVSRPPPKCLSNRYTVRLHTHHVRLNLQKCNCPSFYPAVGAHAILAQVARSPCSPVLSGPHCIPVAMARTAAWPPPANIRRTSGYA